MLGMGNFATTSPFAFESDDGREVIYDTATIEDNFCPSSIVVVLNEEHSQITTRSTAQTNITKRSNIFNDIGVSSIRDLTALPDDNIVNLGGRAIVTDVRAIKQHLSSIVFRQILHIKLKIECKQNVLDTIKKLQGTVGIRYVGPDMFYEGTNTTPNDTDFADQWALVGNNGMKAREAWGITLGTRNVRVGVIDSGIANHPDLDANVVEGWDFVNNNNITNDDFNGHGTSSAGIIGAVGNNKIGVSGVAQQVTLVPLQTMSTDTSNSATAMIDAITYARNTWDTNERIPILSMSISGFGMNTAVRDAVAAYQGLFVWAAGNNGNNLDNIANIGTYGLANLISVGAHNSAGARSVWNTTQSSSFGNAVDIYAPGGHQGAEAEKVRNCWTTAINNGYRGFSGTSAAAPHVAGVAALMLSINPNLTAAQLKTLIKNNAEVIDNFATPAGSQTIRRVNAHRAIASAVFETATSTSGLSIKMRIGVTLPNGADVTIPDRIAPTNGAIGATQQVVTAIAVNGFNGQTGLSQISIPASVTSIGANAFLNTGVWNSAANGVVYISKWAIGVKGTLSGTVTIPSGTRGIADNAFAAQTLVNEFVLPTSYYPYDNVQCIGRDAFLNTGAWNNAANGVVYISRWAVGVKGALSGSLNITDMRGIADYAFVNQTGLTGITIPDSVPNIGNGAFMGCTNLGPEITLPVSVTRIGHSAFSGCNALTAVNVKRFSYSPAYINIGTVGANAFDSTTTVYIPAGSYTAYYSAADWTQYSLRPLASISLDMQEGGPVGSDFISVVPGNYMPEISSSMLSPYRYGYDFDGLYSQPNGKGIKYYSAEFVKNSSGYYYYKLTPTNNKWTTYSDGTLYAYWTPLSLSYDCFVFNDEGDVLESYNVTVKGGGQSTPLTAPPRSGNTFKEWQIHSGAKIHTITASTTSFTFTLFRSTQTGTVEILYSEKHLNPMIGGITIKYTKDSCVADGTLITLADGTQKAVEQLTGDELLLVWNLYTGSFAAAPILFIDSDPAREYEVINLYFSDGTSVKVISEHAFWDVDLNKYVFLRSDAAQYIGHWFNKQVTDADGELSWTSVQLVDVIINNEYTTAWSPVTFGHLCYYVNGMLSMPGATTGLINIFDVDSATMMIDEAAFLADIETYGLFTYEEFAEVLPIPEVIYEAFGGQYLKVAMGKGLINWETLGALIEQYAGFFETEAG